MKMALQVDEMLVAGEDEEKEDGQITPSPKIHALKENFSSPRNVSESTHFQQVGVSQQQHQNTKLAQQVKTDRGNPRLIQDRVDGAEDVIVKSTSSSHSEGRHVSERMLVGDSPGFSDNGYGQMTLSGLSESRGGEEERRLRELLLQQLHNKAQAAYPPPARPGIGCAETVGDGGSTFLDRGEPPLSLGVVESLDGVWEKAKRHETGNQQRARLREVAAMEAKYDLEGKLGARKPSKGELQQLRLSLLLRLRPEKVDSTETKKQRKARMRAQHLNDQRVREELERDRHQLRLLQSKRPDHALEHGRQQHFDGIRKEVLYRRMAFESAFEHHPSVQALSPSSPLEPPQSIPHSDTSLPLSHPKIVQISPSDGPQVVGALHGNNAGPSLVCPNDAMDIAHSMHLKPATFQLLHSSLSTSGSPLMQTHTTAGQMEVVASGAIKSQVSNGVTLTDPSPQGIVSHPVPHVETPGHSSILSIPTFQVEPSIPMHTLPQPIVTNKTSDYASTPSATHQSHSCPSDQPLLKHAPSWVASEVEASGHSTTPAVSMSQTDSLQARPSRPSDAPFQEISNSASLLPTTTPTLAPLLSPLGPRPEASIRMGNECRQRELSSRTLLPGYSNRRSLNSQLTSAPHSHEPHADDSVLATFAPLNDDSPVGATDDHHGEQQTSDHPSISPNYPIHEPPSHISAPHSRGSSLVLGETQTPESKNVSRSAPTSKDSLQLPSLPPPPPTPYSNPPALPPQTPLSGSEAQSNRIARSPVSNKADASAVATERTPAIIPSAARTMPFVCCNTWSSCKNKPARACANHMCGMCCNDRNKADNHLSCAFHQGRLSRRRFPSTSGASPPAAMTESAIDNIVRASISPKLKTPAVPSDTGTVSTSPLPPPLPGDPTLVAETVPPVPFAAGLAGRAMAFPLGSPVRKALLAAAHAMEGRDTATSSGDGERSSIPAEGSAAGPPLVEGKSLAATVRMISAGGSTQSMENGASQRAVMANRGSVRLKEQSGSVEVESSGSCARTRELPAYYRAKVAAGKLKSSSRTHSDKARTIGASRLAPPPEPAQQQPPAQLQVSPKLGPPLANLPSESPLVNPSPVMPPTELSVPPVMPNSPACSGEKGVAAVGKMGNLVETPPSVSQAKPDALQESSARSAKVSKDSVLSSAAMGAGRGKWPPPVPNNGIDSRSRLSMMGVGPIGRGAPPAGKSRSNTWVAGQATQSASLSDRPPLRPTPGVSPSSSRFKWVLSDQTAKAVSARASTPGDIAKVPAVMTRAAGTPLATALQQGLPAIASIHELANDEAGPGKKATPTGVVASNEKEKAEGLSAMDQAAPGAPQVAKPSTSPERPVMQDGRNKWTRDQGSGGVAPVVNGLSVDLLGSKAGRVWQRQVVTGASGKRGLEVTGTVMKGRVGGVMAFLKKPRVTTVSPSRELLKRGGGRRVFAWSREGGSAPAGVSSLRSGARWTRLGQSTNAMASIAFPRKQLVLPPAKKGTLLAFVSKQLQKQRTFRPLYSRSADGFSLKRTGTKGAAGKNMRWTKSIDKRLWEAREVAMRKVAEVEKQRREEREAVLKAKVAVDKAKADRKAERRQAKGEKVTKGERILMVGGVRYKMDPTGKILQRMTEQMTGTGAQAAREALAPRRASVGSAVYVRQGNGSRLVRDPKGVSRALASERMRWSLNNARLRKVRAKELCRFFTRYGRCNKPEGKCPYIHDTSKVAVCIKFLRGTCTNDPCPLTHKVMPERMPDCTYFAKGLCANEACPYRHVNVNRNARACDAFLRGGCSNADQCEMRHTYTCPQHEESGSCPDRATCKLHHPSSRKRAVPTTLPEPEHRKLLRKLSLRSDEVNPSSLKKKRFRAPLDLGDGGIPLEAEIGDAGSLLSPVLSDDLPLQRSHKKARYFSFGVALASTKAGGAEADDKNSIEWTIDNNVASTSTTDASGEGEHENGGGARVGRQESAGGMAGTLGKRTRDREAGMEEVRLSRTRQGLLLKLLVGVEEDRERRIRPRFTFETGAGDSRRLGLQSSPSGLQKTGTGADFDLIVRSGTSAT